jgi:hypothetical protein
MKKRSWRRLIVGMALGLTGAAGLIAYRHITRHDDPLSREPFRLHYVLDSQAIGGPSSADAEVAPILKQRFYYLDQGRQSYAFLSEDGQTVLKCFKYQRFRPSLWSKSDRQQLQEKREALHQSFRLAFEQLAASTGMLCLHLQQTEGLPQSLTLVDAHGHEYVLNPNQLNFALQRRAQMFTPYLERLIAEQRLEEGRLLLDQLVALLMGEYKKGIADGDGACMRNMGVIDGHLVRVDTGRLYQDDSWRQPVVYQRKLLAKVYKLRKWLRVHSMELAAHLDEQLTGVGVSLP